MFADKRIQIQCAGNTGSDHDHLSSLYVRSYERKWPDYKNLFNYVHQQDQNAALKSLQRDLYWHTIQPYIGAPEANSITLDAGCGVGRFTLFLAQQGYHVCGVDASRLAIEAAADNCHVANIDPNRVALWYGDSRDLSQFVDNQFSVSLALELICYHADPLQTLAELKRVTQPGGIVAISVEGLLGSVLADDKLSTTEVQRALAEHQIHIPEELYVHYYTRETLQLLLDQAELQCLEIVGTHYVLDGPFKRLCAGLNLWKTDARQAILEQEKNFSVQLETKPLARAWLAICRIPA